MGGLVPIDNYVRATKTLVDKHQLDDVHIFLTTEDRAASNAYRNHYYVVGNNWKIYEYKDAISNNTSEHTPSIDAKDTKGKFGLISMIVLLLSMESQFYVLTTGSNWSGVIAGLRLGVVDAECNGCTDWIDLRITPMLRKQVVAFNMAHKLPMNYPYNNEWILLEPYGSVLLPLTSVVSKNTSANGGSFREAKSTVVTI